MFLCLLLLAHTFHTITLWQEVPPILRRRLHRMCLNLKLSILLFGIERIDCLITSFKGFDFASVGLMFKRFVC